jgi:flagellar operon protein (TIGR03826 family)
MEDFITCPRCGEIYLKNKFRDVCPNCYKKEEEDFHIVSKFLRKRENRAATIDQIVTQTGVSEETIIKLVQKGRLQPKQFPNLGYPCDRCGRIIKSGKLCETCAKELRDELEIFHKEEKRKQELLEREKRTYYSQRSKDYLK